LFWLEGENVLKTIQEWRKIIKTGVTYLLILTVHALERRAQRFEERELEFVYKAIDYAFKRTPFDPLKTEQPETRVTHPLYGITVVGQRVGLNGFKVVTIYKKGQPDD
jgi:hypothetical protein